MDAVGVIGTVAVLVAPAARCAHPPIFVTGCPTPKVYGKLKIIVYLSLISNRFLSLQVCVKTCPTQSFVAAVEVDTSGEELFKKRLICKENVTLSQYSVQELVDLGLCARYYLESEPRKFSLLSMLSCLLRQKALMAFVYLSCQTVLALSQVTKHHKSCSNQYLLLKTSTSHTKKTVSAKKQQQ